MPYRFNPLPWRFDRVDSGTVNPDIETLTGDSGGAVGPDGSFNINILGNPDIEVAGNPGTNTLQLTNLTKITPYVVCDTDGAYSTIQDAINAISAGGVPATIFLCPGTYTEDLTLPDVDLTIWSDPGALATIVGIHTPSATADINFFGIVFQSATDILNSAAAGAGDVFFFGCFMIVTNGYVCNLENWTGQISFDNCGEASTNDGAVYNLGGSFIKMINTEMGAGSGQTMTLSGGGLVRFDTCNINCPVSIQGAGSFIIQNGCKIANTLTIAGSRTGTFVNGSILSDTAPSLIYSSSGDSTLTDIAMSSSDSEPIQGSGSGSLTLYDITMIQEDQISPSTNTPNLYWTLLGNGQTVNAATADLITYELRNVAATYNFRAFLTGISNAGDGVTGTLEGAFVTDGATATIIGSVDQNIDPQAGIAAATATFVISGNSIICRATGSAGSTINWNARVEFIMVNV